MNLYDPYIVNKMIGGYQMVITWHVGDLKISHHMGAAITGVIGWLETIYDTFNASRGDKHQYFSVEPD